ncbi:MAG: chromosome segregation protein SMC [Acidimicrobiia bacterium]|nr:chromosome segregation protein SMC [Acidimicrobiia bacterium]
MRLERLEINGFKSFSDRSELAFDKGVTAIVGPNGCGKSNVADAITWVMGEQSAKSLRGDKMEDVIFNGSDARKPTASAEVRLRFSGVLRTVTGPAFEGGRGHVGNGHGYTNGNGHHAEANGHHNGQVALSSSEPTAEATSDDAPTAVTASAALSREEAEEIIQTVAREVEVTRRLYRSGESEYLIDGQLCRLRDIHELLMDTGLGAKAYAIIEQGKIGVILSSRPTDRRQLIEEAAGVTKYKSRRRAAELKLEAAQQNLTRIDDIVFEVEKQRGTLKRQAAKARRYQALRDEMRRWEKQLFARKYRQLAETIESTRTRLAEARERESLGASRVAEVESNLARVRIESVEAETVANRTRETAHARELELNRRQQQLAFDRSQIESLTARLESVGAELASLGARREPAQLALLARRTAVSEAATERERASHVLSVESDAYEAAHRDIEGLEADVEAARSEVFSAINAATALRHSLDHAAAQRERVIETLGRLQIESDDLRVESERVDVEDRASRDGLRRAQEALEETRIGRAARESELASARIEHEWRSRAIRTHEQEIAGLEARLNSLQELEAARAEYGDAARAVLALANGRVGQRGAVADYLEVDAGFERAVETCLGDLLQFVVVERPEQAATGFEIVREQRAGRCGFLVVGGTTSELWGALDSSAETPGVGLRPLASVLRINGPYAAAVRGAIGPAWIADSYNVAAEQAPFLAAPVATVTGELFRGAHLVSGGVPAEARGILETKRAIKDLCARLDIERTSLTRLVEEAAGFHQTITLAASAIEGLLAEHHTHEKAIVGYEGQVRRSEEDRRRLEQRGEQLTRERRQLEEERELLDRRQHEARASIQQLEGQQRTADETLTSAQRRLFEARESAQDLAKRTAEAKAAHAGLVERVSAIVAEVLRMEEASADLELRASSLAGELDTTRRRIEQLLTDVASGERQLDEDVAAISSLRDEVLAADIAAGERRAHSDALETEIRSSRAALDAIRGTVSELDIARATAESDLSHLAQMCVDAVQATLDDVMIEVAAIDEAGGLVAGPVLASDDAEDTGEDGESAGAAEASPASETDLNVPHAAVLEAQQRTITAEEAIARLRAKIDRLGPVNMMAIEQYDELEQRHTFLTTQRKDLVDSIAQTTEAIRRIDETTRTRFAEAFSAINRYFQELFSALFGGGRAGLTLLDENDPLESGIEIIAQPPGKRLQSVQLLSGGEKALTAISLMFSLFKYKPSPFCLLDEIDAPLDDANIGRFVEMLRGMQHHTQFILITHHRKTMEIADRLYGVTMEEPGVSKLISVQMN